MPVNVVGLNKTYQGMSVIDDFSYTFEEGKVYCLFGPSGCGKTTLLHTIAGLVSGDSGEIKGVDNHSISMVFQENRLLPWFTALDNITLVADVETDVARKYLKAVDLEGFEHFYPTQLSGGMKRRVAIARALAYQGRLLLMDEAFKGIDDMLKRKIMSTILGEIDRDRTVIFTTHNMEEARFMADEIIQFNRVVSDQVKVMRLDLVKQLEDVN